MDELDDVLAQLENIQTGGLMACSYDSTTLGILVSTNHHAIQGWSLTKQLVKMALRNPKTLFRWLCQIRQLRRRRSSNRSRWRHLELVHSEDIKPVWGTVNTLKETMVWEIAVHLSRDLGVVDREQVEGMIMTKKKMCLLNYSEPNMAPHILGKEKNKVSSLSLVPHVPTTHHLSSSTCEEDFSFSWHEAISWLRVIPTRY